MEFYFEQKYRLMYFFKYMLFFFLAYSSKNCRFKLTQKQFDLTIK